MKTSQKLNMDDAVLEAQLMERIEKLIQQTILETIFDFLNQMIAHKKSLRPPVCYKSDCQNRDEIPF